MAGDKINTALPKHRQQFEFCDVIYRCADNIRHLHDGNLVLPAEEVSRFKANMTTAHNNNIFILQSLSAQKNILNSIDVIRVYSRNIRHDLKSAHSHKDTIGIQAFQLLNVRRTIEINLNPKFRELVFLRFNVFRNKALAGCF